MLGIHGYYLAETGARAAPHGFSGVFPMTLRDLAGQPTEFTDELKEVACQLVRSLFRIRAQLTVRGTSVAVQRPPPSSYTTSVGL
jgi:hypothetical protein